MNAQLEHLLKLIAGESNDSDSADSSERGSARDSDLELLDAYSRAVVSVVDSVGPAVVSIAVGQQQRGTEADQTGAGSGVVIAPDGYILTNDHVVQNADRLKVRLTDGATLSATVIGKDPATDLAVIRTDASYLTCSTLGSSDPLRVGQLVIAMGNPFGFQSTVFFCQLPSLCAMVSRTSRLGPARPIWPRSRRAPGPRRSARWLHARRRRVRRPRSCGFRHRHG